jgi:hypothetical protein
MLTLLEGNVMNERIFSLAKQFNLIQWDTLPSGARTPDHESVVRAIKFAELIIGECADQCDMLLNDKMSSEWTRGTHDCAKAIREYFGVE